jgi:hypothetical protein
MSKTEATAPPYKTPESTADRAPQKPRTKPAKEIGGRDGLDPTRYGDWEKNGRAVDF